MSERHPTAEEIARDMVIAWLGTPGQAKVWANSPAADIGTAIGTVYAKALEQVRTANRGG